MQYDGCVFYEIVILNQDEDENDESSEDVSASLVHALLLFSLVSCSPDDISVIHSG